MSLVPSLCTLVKGVWNNLCGSCRCDQLDAADKILECLPMGTAGLVYGAHIYGSSDGSLYCPTRLSEELLVVHKDIDKLEDHLR